MKIDINATKENVDMLLSNVQQIKRVSSYNARTKKYMPISHLPNSTMPEGIPQQMDSAVFVKEIDFTVDHLIPEDSRKRLAAHYFEDTGASYRYEIYDRFNESHDTYYKRLRDAQIHFAEGFLSGALLVYQQD